MKTRNIQTKLAGRCRASRGLPRPESSGRTSCLFEGVRDVAGTVECLQGRFSSVSTPPADPLPDGASSAPCPALRSLMTTPRAGTGDTKGEVGREGRST